MKRTLAALLCLTALLLCIAMPVSAADGEDSARVSVGDAEYDRASQKFIYRVGTCEVQSNLPSGAVTTGTLSVKVPEGMSWRLFRNGSEVTDADLGAVTEKGKYILLFDDANGTSLKYTLVSSLTGALTEYTVPEGFSLTSVTLDGEEQTLSSSYIADLSREGRYAIRYECERAELVYDLILTVDHTPPVLKLEAVRDGYASGPVDISDLEPDTQIALTLNGSPFAYEKTLTRSGDYHITLRDRAGNTTEYRFVVRTYFNFNSFVFLFILIGVAAALTVYLVMSRRKMRIR